MNLSLTIIVRFLILVIWVVLVKTLDESGKVYSGLETTQYNPGQYEDDRHETTCLRECIRYSHYLSFGLLIRIVKQYWKVDKTVFCIRFTVTINKVIKLHPGFNILNILWVRKYHTIVQWNHVLTKIEEILLRSIECSFCHKIFHVFFDGLFKIFIIKVAV